MQEVRDTIAGRGVKFLLIVDDYHVVSSQYVDTRAYTEKIGGGGGGGANFLALRTNFALPTIISVYALAPPPDPLVAYIFFNINLFSL